MSQKDADCTTGADALLTALKDVGVDYLFANAGTDFLPVIEGFAKLPADAVPEPITVPHETAAVAMAHGHWLVTGKPQAVMVHVNVGLANAVMGVINAMSDNIPMLVLSGRTPLTEKGRDGSRASQVQYGQEMPDQAALVRGSVKYEYEMRYPEQADALVHRAMAIAQSEPCGPVYLSLPREPLSEALPPHHAPAPAQAPAQPPAAHAGALAVLKDWTRCAKSPLVICQRGDPQGRLGAVLSHAAKHLGLAVAEPFSVRNVLASDDPSLVSYLTRSVMQEADLIIALDCPVPWVAAHGEPASGAKVVHVSPDPHFARMSIRGYRSDLSIAADPATVLEALVAACPPADPDRIAKTLAQSRARHCASAAEVVTPGSKGAPMSPAFFSKCVSDIMDREAVAFTELGLLHDVMQLQGPNRVLSHPHSGGLGWALPAALGAQMADRSRLVIAATGDGSYMFANPVACHQIAEALELPVLILVKNNSMWNAVRRSVSASYPEGASARQNQMPLTSLAPVPDFAKIAQASRGYAERVEQGDDLPAALGRALEVIRTERRHALLDVKVAATDAF